MVPNSIAQSKDRATRHFNLLAGDGRNDYETRGGLVRIAANAIWRKQECLCYGKGWSDAPALPVLREQKDWKGGQEGVVLYARLVARVCGNA